MTIFQTGLRNLAGASAVRWAQERAQKLSSNSFTEKLVEAYSRAPVRKATTTAAKTTSATAARTTSTARQQNVATGRNLVGTSSPSSQAAPKLSPFAASTATTGTPTTGTPTLTSASAPKNQLSAEAITSANGGSTATTNGEEMVAPSIAAVNGPQPASDIVAQLLKDNAPPAPYAAVGSGSSDPAVYRTDNYIKMLNLNSFLQVANHDNAYRYDQYSFQLHMWTENGMQGPPPPAPKYETVDLKGFDDWWAQYNANIGADAPSPASFLANGPKDGGYGWTA